jgi:aconitate hydratase
MLVPPTQNGKTIELVKGPNIKPLPSFAPLPEEIEGPALLVVGDDISTDEIMPAGAKVLPYRSNIPEISKFVFAPVDESYYERAMSQQQSGHFVVAGENYGQGSSREHAAIAPRYLGLQAVIAKNFARIHWQNLVNFGILPLTFANPAEHEYIEQDDVLYIAEVRRAIESGQRIEVHNQTKKSVFTAVHSLSSRQIEILLAGGLISYFRQQQRQHNGRDKDDKS